MPLRDKMAAQAIRGNYLPEDIFARSLGPLTGRTRCREACLEWCSNALYMLAARLYDTRQRKQNPVLRESDMRLVPVPTGRHPRRQTNRKCFEGYLHGNVAAEVSLKSA